MGCSLDSVLEPGRKGLEAGWTQVGGAERGWKESALGWGRGTHCEGAGCLVLGGGAGGKVSQDKPPRVHGPSGVGAEGQRVGIQGGRCQEPSPAVTCHHKIKSDIQACWGTRNSVGVAAQPAEDEGDGNHAADATHPPFPPSLHPSIHPTYSTSHPPFPPSIYPSLHPSTHPSIHPTSPTYSTSHPPTHPPISICPPTHGIIHLSSLTHPSTHPLPHPPSLPSFPSLPFPSLPFPSLPSISIQPPHSSTHSSTQPPIRSSISTHPYICPPLTQPSNQPSTHASTQSPIHPFTNHPPQSISIYPSIPLLLIQPSFVDSSNVSYTPGTGLGKVCV
ncbi:uncharacterized protein [Dasypus novemcinctus]|uniref:uncharacterized protein n=1 Tax=Dasypus novemcinctus TaxID=9361 RepID=UPI0039C9B90F